MEEKIIKRLKELSDRKYRDFNSKLVPNINNVLGVRIPVLRNYANELYNDKGFAVDEFISISSAPFMEFTMLQGFLIGLKKSGREEFFRDVKNFVPKINNWAVCDTFCASVKLVKKYPAETFEFTQKYFKSKKEYEIRFGVVILLTYFINDEYIDRVLEILVNLSSNDYYAQMGIAWALSICYVNYFEKTHEVVSNSNLLKEIKVKSARKVIESLRPTKEEKDFLRKYIKSLQN